MCVKATVLVRQPWLQPLRFLFFAFTKLLKKALTLEGIRTLVCRVFPALFVPPLFRSARKFATRSLDRSSTALSSSSFRLGKSSLRLFRRESISSSIGAMRSLSTLYPPPSVCNSPDRFLSAEHNFAPALGGGLRMRLDVSANVLNEVRSNIPRII